MAKAHPLVDNVNDNVIDFPARWGPAVGLAREVDGRIEIPLPIGRWERLSRVDRSV
jgi:hypothetical protein